MQEKIEDEMEKNLKNLKERQKQTRPSDIMVMFKNLVEDPNSSIIF